jgi:hypothetical protein
MAFIDLPVTLQVEPWKMKDLCYKLADTSSRSLKKPIWLRPGQVGCTDGRIIQAPLTDPEGYLVTGHEVAHIAFGSRPEVATAFAKQLADATVRNFLGKGNTTLKGHEPGLESLIFSLTNIMDDHRVTCWWGKAYPGDRHLLEARWTRMMSDPERQQMARVDLLQFMLAVMVGQSPPDADPDFLHALDVMEQSFVDVGSVDFTQCLAITKKLFEKLVRIFAKQLKARQPPPPMAGQPGGHDQGNGQDQDAQDQESGDEQGEDGEGESKGDPKEDPKEKTERQAFRLLLLTGQADQSKLQGTDFADLKMSDWHKKMAAQGKVPKDVQAQVTAALNSALSDEELEEAEEAMKFVVQTLRGEAAKEDKDEYLRAQAFSKVIFNDVPKERLLPVDLNEAELRTVRKARAKFVQIQGKKRRQLEEQGTSIDIGQAIQRKFKKEGPIFKSDIKAPGFHYLLLGDGSGSMVGAPFEAVRRAVAVLSKSLNFPAVSGKLWVYQGEGKACTISRVPKPANGVPAANDYTVLGGYTPTHTAIRVAIREMQLAKGIRRIFLMTDGEPNGHPKAQWLVRRNIIEGRRYGIQTYTLYIGGGAIAPLAKMAGGRKFLTQCNHDEIDTALIQLVEMQFRHYLQERT